MTTLWRIITLQKVRPGLKWAILLVPFLCLVPALFCSLSFTMDSLRLLGEGIEVQGTVLDKRIDENRDDDGNTTYTYYIDYAFDAGLGDPPDFMSESEIVARSIYDRYDPGQAIPVTFLYEKPWISSVDPHRYYENSIIFLVCIGLWVILLAIVVTINVVVGLRRSAVSTQ